MSRATRRRIAEQVPSLRDSTILPFHDILDATMVEAALAEERVTFSEPLYTPLVTLGLSLSQVLSPDHSCREAVARRIVWLAINGRKTCAPETGSYRDARQRLPLAWSRARPARPAATWRTEPLPGETRERGKIGVGHALSLHGSCLVLHVVWVELILHHGGLEW